jgi:hyperosmotically inducible protein
MEYNNGNYRVRSEPGKQNVLVDPGNVSASCWGNAILHDETKKYQYIIIKAEQVWNVLCCLCLKNTMKKVICVIVIVAFFGCTQKDNDIKKSIAAKAKEELMFAGVDYRVRSGIVTLSGNSPSEELKNKLINSLKSTGGVKKVVDSIVVSPVVLDDDFILKQKVDSVLAGYATIETTVKNGVVTLDGELGKVQKEKLFQALNKLPLSGIVNNLLLK